MGLSALSMELRLASYLNMPRDYIFNILLSATLNLVNLLYLFMFFKSLSLRLLLDTSNSIKLGNYGKLSKDM